METLETLFDLLKDSPGPYHAVQRAARVLTEAGFEGLSEGTPWELRPGGKYFVTRNQTSIIAWKQPAEKPACWHFTASHSDSPTWRIKTTGSAQNRYTRAEVEGYGGMIMSSWLDRPLSAAGRVMCRTEDGVEAKLVNLDRDLFVIPNQAIHVNRQVNTGYNFNAQEDLQPIIGSAQKDFKGVLAAAAGVQPEDILDMDLNLIVRDAPRVVGLEDEFFMAPRIDDLECCFTTLLGFLRSERQEGFWCMFDNEEVGSTTRQGAHGTFLPDVLNRCAAALGMTEDERLAALNNSLLLSCDNAHAVHPNHPEKYDREHWVEMNGGVVIKFSASERYTSTGLTASLMKLVCEKAGVPWQMFANRADQPGGGTLGNLLSEQLSIPMVDIGLAQLAMHSAVETAGTKDPDYMVRAVAQYFDTALTQTRDGVWKLN